MIHWEEFHAPVKARRVRGVGSETHAKHVVSEQERRKDLSHAIDELSSLVPEPSSGSREKSRTTKLKLVQNATEYLGRVQDAALTLLEENKKLKETLRQREEQLAAVSASASSLPSATRIFVVLIFMTACLFFSSKSPMSWSTTTDTSTAVQRSILSVAPNQFQSSRPLLYTIFRFVAFLAFLLILIPVLSLPRFISAEKYSLAQKFAASAERSVVSNPPNWTMIMDMRRTVLQMLGHARSDIYFHDIRVVCCIVAQVLRSLLSAFGIGYWIEKLFVCHILKVSHLIELESRALLLASPSSFLEELGSLLTIINNLRLLWRMHSNDSDHDTLLALRKQRSDVISRLNASLSVITPQKRLRFFTLCFLASMIPHDNASLSDWRLVTAILWPVMRGRYDEAINNVHDTISCVHGGTLFAKLVTFGGSVFFCGRRFEEAFIMHASALQLCNTQVTPPAVVVMLLSSMCVSLSFIGCQEDAKHLYKRLIDILEVRKEKRMPLSTQESWLVLATDVIVHHVSDSSCHNDEYYAKLFSLTERLLDVAESDKRITVPVYHSAHMVEVIAVQLLRSLMAANNRESLFVVTRREAILDLFDRLLSLISLWSRSGLSQPMLERLKAWRAYVVNDTATASYHFRQSLLASAPHVILTQEWQVTSDLLRVLCIEAI